MRLKSIEIFGFKSFADKTRIEFHEGITGIVGPNGCGKSNISDSFRWVLGEQSAKSMRGDKMFDVIFAGTSKRKPLNIAEVTLVLTDVNGSLPLEFEEVAVTRRIHRSGESDYFINKRPVRLKDVQSLFMDSGIGKDAFAIFEQGKIDQVINYPPLERRYIFEEAAGIVRFLQRKREAFRKLELTEGNVTRVKDIHKEVEKRIIVLEDQAEKAKIYKESKSKLELLEKALFVSKWDLFEKKKEGTEEQKQQIQTKIEGMTFDLKELEKKLASEKFYLNEQEKHLRARSEGLYLVKSEREIFIRERAARQTRLKEIQAEREKKQSLVNQLTEEMELSSEEKKKLILSLEKIGESFKVSEEQKKKSQEALHGLDHELSACRALLQQEQKELVELVQQEKRIEGELKQHAVRLEGIVNRRTHLDTLESELFHHQGKLQADLDEQKKFCEEETSRLQQKKEELKILDQLIVDLKQKIQAQEELRQKFSRQVAEFEAREKVLIRLKNDMEGVSLATKKILQESLKQGSPLFGKVKGIWEEAAPDQGQESAFALVMSHYAETLVVQTKQDLVDLLAFAKSSNLKDFSVICLDMVEEKSLSGHFTRRTQDLNTLDEALLSSSDQTVVCSREGFFIDLNRVLVFANQGEKNAFFREAELKKCAKELEKSKEALHEVQSELAGLFKERDQKQQERNGLDSTIRQMEMKLVERHVTIQKIEHDLNRLLKDQGKFAQDKEELENASFKLKDLIKDLDERHLEAKQKSETLKMETEARQKSLESKVAVYREHEEKNRQTVAEFQKVQEELRTVEHQVDMLEVKFMENKRQKERLVEEVSLSFVQEQEMMQKQTSSDEELAEIEERLTQAQESVLSIDDKVKSVKESLFQIEESIAALRESLKAEESLAGHQAVKLAEMQSAASALENELFDRYQMSLDDVRDLIPPLEKSIESTEREIRQLKKGLEEAGDVNMTSIQEHADLKERYEFLNKQLDDLEASKQELVQIITELDTESRKIFKEVFEVIRANFQKNFQILFNGGEADLQLTESNDILEAGIEILAKPPGKQMRSIQLMSGGEKCLTSIALLFAIFEVKPSPFCILDEIDAPLDDTNVERFLNVVKQFTDKCQFIIITHNKRTMAIADRLFGVSMQERGVSRLLQMEFSREDSKEPVLV